ncbi:DUF6953 family protein [Altererythrobacter sp. MTPC7]|uniref:DUF6953 family protein n=1 Tax=Altererythrobacter sp. MTPC7 TaxID=3056567 RepID=UPI0036F2AECB
MMTSDQAAQWMEEQYLLFNHVLYQDYVASCLLHAESGQTYFDKSANLCVAKDALKQFRKRLPDIVYDRREKCWRDRLESDQPGRQQ